MDVRELARLAVYPIREPAAYPLLSTMSFAASPPTFRMSEAVFAVVLTTESARSREVFKREPVMSTDFSRIAYTDPEF